MDYQKYTPHPDLSSIIQFYWTLKVPASNENQKQRIVPDGNIEMAFILGDDIKRYTNEKDFILQPRAMVLGQTMAPFFIEPTGEVNTFAISFHPYGFANLTDQPIKTLADQETPLQNVLEKTIAKNLNSSIVNAKDTQQRINCFEKFMFEKLKDPSTVDTIVASTVDALIASNGNASIQNLLKENPSKRRQLERKFAQQIGVSPKQLSKVIRMQRALKMLIGQEQKNLSAIAHENEYYDQAHFIKDFKTFTGVSPKDFLSDESLQLSALFHKE